MGHKNANKWLVLAAVASALLVVPRRSSRKADMVLPDKKEWDVDNKHADDKHTNNDCVEDDKVAADALWYKL